MFHLVFLFLFRKKKLRTGSGRLPSLYGQTLIKSEYEYRREIRRKLEQIQHDNRDCIRRRLANDHMFAQGLLNKRHQWFTVDKSYRDACRTTWNRQENELGRRSHLILPSVYSSVNTSPLTMASMHTVQSHDTENENPAVTDARIKQDFLRVQPVMLELLSAPHSSKFLKIKQEVELRKKSAQRRQVQIQATARSDDRYTQLVGSLQDV